MQSQDLGKKHKDNRLMHVLSVWGIMLVVLGHSGFTEQLIVNQYRSLQHWIYSFHMPLFVFISGYIYSFTNNSFSNISDKRFLYKKVKRLLVPYFVLGTILFFIKLFFSQFSHNTLREFSFYSYFEMFFVPQSQNSTLGYLWFVSALFSIFLFVRLFDKININLKNIKSSLCIVLCCWFLYYVLPKIDFLQFSNVLWYLSFFIIGILFEVNQYRFKYLSKFNNIFTTLILAYVSIYVQMLNCEIALIINILRAIIGIVFSISLCSLILKYYHKENVFLSKYTYSIYLLSWFGQYGIQILLVKVFNIGINSYFILFLFLAGLILPVLICKIIEKIDNGSIFLKKIKLIIGL